jgi:hemerythrin-like metal-binding protein
MLRWVGVIKAQSSRRDRCALVLPVQFEQQHFHRLESVFRGRGDPRRRIVKDLVWSEILSVGVGEIDEDHRKLLNIFNILNHAVKEGASLDYLAATLEELINCTVWHFSHEERLMLKHGYEGMEEHKAEHRELVQSARELQQEILRADKPVAEEHIEFLERWLTEHIFTADMRLGSYLSQVM